MLKYKFTIFNLFILKIWSLKSNTMIHFSLLFYIAYCFLILDKNYVSLIVIKYFFVKEYN